MLKEKLKSGIKNLALGLVLSAVAITSFGCGDVEQTSGELTQSGAKTQNAQEQKITISCAGDCTLGTDAAFGGVTFPVEKFRIRAAITADSSQKCSKIFCK